jgi:hypothetical protein
MIDLDAMPGACVPSGKRQEADPMMRPTEQRAEQARRQAQDLFARDRAKEAEVVTEREKGFAVQTQKTARLRALRLAREAQERATAAAQPPVVKAPKKAIKTKAESKAEG